MKVEMDNLDFIWNKKAPMINQGGQIIVRKSSLN